MLHTISWVEHGKLILVCLAGYYAYVLVKFFPLSLVRLRFLGRKGNGQMEDWMSDVLIGVTFNHTNRPFPVIKDTLLPPETVQLMYRNWAIRTRVERVNNWLLYFYEIGTLFRPG